MFIYSFQQRYVHVEVDLHSKIFKYQKGGNLIPSWLKSTLTWTIGLFKL